MKRDVALRRAGAAVLMGIAIAGMALRRYEGRTLSRKNWPMEHRGVDSNWLVVLSAWSR